MTYLVHTNVWSELRKREPAASVVAWRNTVDAEELFSSVLVIGEIRQGIEHLRRRDRHQAAVFERWLSGIKLEFQHRILPVTSQIAEAWGRLNVPDRLPAVDGLLAATALVHGLT